MTSDKTSTARAIILEQERLKRLYRHTAEFLLINTEQLVRIEPYTPDDYIVMHDERYNPYKQDVHYILRGYCPLHGIPAREHKRDNRYMLHQYDVKIYYVVYDTVFI